MQSLSAAGIGPAFTPETGCAFLYEKREYPVSDVKVEPICALGPARQALYCRFSAFIGNAELVGRAGEGFGFKLGM